MEAEVIDKLTGKAIETPANVINLSDPSVVRLNLDRSQVADLTRQGDDLIVRLTDGQVIRVNQFYHQVNGTISDLVLREPNNTLWVANTAATGAARFTLLNGIEDLVAAGGAAGGGSSSILPAVLGVAGLGAAVAAGGGGGGGGGDGGSTTPPPTTPPDTIAPAQPTASFGSNGGTVIGTGEAGATVTVRDPAGAVIGTGTVGSNGAYTVTLNQPQANGQTVTVTQADAAGNVSQGVTATAPDLTAPGAPAATINAAGTTVTGTGEAGATVTVRDAAGQTLGTGTVDAQGNYSVSVVPPQTSGGTLTVTQADAAGNVSAGTSVTPPDSTAPGAPDATVTPDGTAVVGRGEPGATVTATNAAGQPVATGTVGADGTFTAPLLSGEANGQTISVTQRDPAGNVSPPAAVRTPDLIAPDAPTATVGTDGNSVSGTGEAGATVTVRDASGATIGTATVGADGNYVVAITPAQENGETISVTQADPAGNTSPATSAVAPDNTAPEAPIAAVSPDGTTVSGNGEAGATVTVRAEDGAVLGTGIVAADGTFSVPLGSPQANGQQLDVDQTDPAGNISLPATIDAPDVTAPTGLTATVSGDGAVVTGNGEPGATIIVRDSAGAQIGTAVAGDDGSYTVILSSAQLNGQVLQVTATDAAGNVSLPTRATAPDLTAPDVPAGSVSADGTLLSGTGEAGASVTVRAADGTALGTGVVAADGTFGVILTPAQNNGQALQLTQTDPAGNVSPAVTVNAPDTTAPIGLTAAVSGDGMLVTGTGEAGATVTVRNPAGTAIGTTTVAGDGSYVVMLDTPQRNGETLQVTQADVGGNVSPVVNPIAPDLTAPLVPTGTLSTIGATVSGTGEAGATVTIRAADGSVIGSALVDANGAYTAPLTSPQTNGEALTVMQQDAAGNTSPSLQLTAADTTAPTGLTATIDGNGTVVSGVAEAGATVIVRDPLGGTIGSVVAAANGAYSIVLTPAQANGETLQVTQTDAAGNASVAVAVTAPDITAPAAPVFTLDPDGAGVTGTGEAGATVTIRDAGGTIIGDALVDAAGNFSATLTPAQDNGGTVSATQADVAGNVSPPGTAPAPDITGPAQPVASLDVTGSVVIGTGEPGATVTVRVGATVLGHALVDAQGNFSVVLAVPQIDRETLVVVQADVAGNISPDLILTAPDLTAPLAPIGAVAADGASLSGSGEIGATVIVTDPVGRLLGTTVIAAADGSFTVTLIPPQIDAEVVTLTQTDLAGNVSLPGTATAPDLTPGVTPGAPTATVSIDGTTVNGTGQVGATVRVFDPAGVEIGTAVITGAGVYVVALTTAQVDGETLRVTQTDGVGTSPPALAVAPDLTAPPAPIATIDAAGVTVTGTGEAGATARVADANNATLGTATVQGNGNFVVVLAPPQTNGEALVVTQVDAAANVSLPTGVTAPDTTAPGAPIGVISLDGTVIAGNGEAGATVTVRDAAGGIIATVVVAGDGSFSVPLTPIQANGQLVSLNQADVAGNVSASATVLAPDITAPLAPTATIAASGALVIGTGEVGATVTVRDAVGNAIGSAIVGAGGTFAVTLGTPLLNGETVQVTQADVAGNISPATPALAPDITAPAAPIGVVTGGGTVLTGTGEVGALVTVRGPGGGVLGTATVAADGTFSVPLLTAQANGQLLQVTQADPAGNVSPIATVIAPDITAPIGLTAAVNGIGTLVTGIGEAGATVTVRDTLGAALGTAVVAPNGTYSVVLTAAQANGQTLQVTQVDAAGNASLPVVTLAPDITPPGLPTGIVNATGISVSGTGEAGASIRITNALGAVIGTALVAGNGTYTATLSIPQANGQTLGLTQTDAAGNVSVSATLLAPDITPPAPPTATINGLGTVIVGTGEPNATVEVRNAGGTVIGSGTVAAGGGYSIVLPVAQVAGEALTITQRDPAGNASTAVSITAPFDIGAFDNVATATIDIAPVQTNQNAGTANYLALVSLGLINLDAQVLAIPNVQFTVQAGHRFDATFTYDALATIGVRGGYSVVVQRFNGTNWVAVSGPGNSSLFDLSLLGGNLVATADLGPGQYRAFVSFDGPAGVGLLGGLNVAGVNSDFTDVGGVNVSVTTGNVITDPGPTGLVDVVSPRTVIQSVTIAGITTAVAANGTSVVGQWGTLVINLDGSYTYTPASDASGIGKVESFTYTLVDRSDGELESAMLTIAIGSPDIFGTPIAVNDIATATATFANVVTQIPAAVDSTFNTATALVLNGPQTGRVNDSFTVSGNSTANVTLTAVVGLGVSVLPSYTITVTNQQGTVVGTVSGTALAGLLGSGVTLTIPNLPSGTYNYTVSSTNALGVGYGTSVFVAQTVTNLDQHVLTGSTTVQGELLANDTLGSSFVGIKVLSNGAYVGVGETPLTIVGPHGTLTIDETGHYSYVPNAALGYTATDPVDHFFYQLVQPDGQFATARLDVAIDINNGVAPVFPTGPVSLVTQGAAGEPDVISLATLTAHAAEAHDQTHQSQSAVVDLQLPHDTADGLLGAFLAAQTTVPDHPTDTHVTTIAASAGIADTTSVTVDPLAYLAVQPDDEHNRIALTHAL